MNGLSKISGKQSLKKFTLPILNTLSHLSGFAVILLFLNHVRKVSVNVSRLSATFLIILAR